MIRRITALFTILIFTSTLCFSQEDTLPAPYKPDEFPQWTLDLRRAEVITVGSFPLTFMVTALVYDLSYMAYDTIQYNNGQSSVGAIFGSHRSQPEPGDIGDIGRILLISGGISIGIGLADFIINQVKRSKAEKEEQERNEQRRDNSDSAGIGESEN